MSGTIPITEVQLTILSSLRLVSARPWNMHEAEPRALLRSQLLCPFLGGVIHVLFNLALIRRQEESSMLNKYLLTA